MYKIRWNLLLLALGNSILFGSEMIGSKSQGEWQRGNYVQVNVGCSQTWVCTPGTNVIHSPDTIVVTSGNAMTAGVCNVADGPVGSCNACAASLPSRPCEYWLEKK
jgi:hypothetical protein